MKQGFVRVVDKDLNASKGISRNANAMVFHLLRKKGHLLNSDTVIACAEIACCS